MTKVQVKHASVTLLLLAFVVSLAIVAMAQFGIFDLSNILTDVWTAVAAIFVLIEVSVLSVIRGKSKGDAFKWFGVIVAGTSLLIVALSWIAIIPVSLVAIKGYVNLLVAIYFVVEIFKN